VKRAEFDWRKVFAALGPADLSLDWDARGALRKVPRPMWPSKRYELIYGELSTRLFSPERKPDRQFGTSVEELEQVADALFVELSRAGDDPDQVVAYRREEAARSLLAAKRVARATREQPSFFQTTEGKA
jgi:hypothetical protein